MTKTLDELRAAFKKPENNNNHNSDDRYLPYFDLPAGENCVVRFLEDLNEDNPNGFLTEQSYHILKINGQNTKVGCSNNWEKNSCPLCAKSQEFYKAEGDTSQMGRTLWKRWKRNTQVLVIKWIDDEPNDYEGKVFLLNLSKQLFEQVESAINDVEDGLDSLPFNTTANNFIIRKTIDATRPNYSTSGFARKETSLSKAQIKIVESDSYDLSTLLDERPEAEQVSTALNTFLGGVEEAEVSVAPLVETDTDTAEFAKEKVDIMADIRNRRTAKAK